MTITSHTVHLSVAGADTAAQWYADAFGATERSRILLPGDRLIHVQLRIGDLDVTIADEFPELDSYGPAHFGGTYGAIYLHVDDVDAAWQQAVGVGAEVVRPVSDAFWGEREGQLLDPFGHRWGLTQHLRDVPRAELQRLATAAFSGDQP